MIVTTNATFNDSYCVIKWVTLYSEHFCRIWNVRRQGWALRMGSPQEHPGSGMLPWMRQLGADPPSLHLPLLPHLAQMLLWPPHLQRAQSQKKRKHLEDLIQEREAAREREATEREERRWRRRRNTEKENDKSERIDGYEKPKTEERRHREAVEREERRERETRERDEPYLALLELIAKK